MMLGRGSLDVSEFEKSQPLKVTHMPSMWSISDCHLIPITNQPKKVWEFCNSLAFQKFNEFEFEDDDTIGNAAK